MSGLIISEVVEGSSNNKAIEIYNGTGAAIDLSQGQYVIQMYFNGSATAGLTIALSGVIQPGEVFVLAHSSASAAILNVADQTNGSGWFNGDDAIVLRAGGAGGQVLDVVGQIGVDPGTEWGSGLTSTADNTLRRKPTVTTGDTNGSDAFDPSVQWEGLANDTFSGLGVHSTTGGTPVVSVAATDAQGVEGSDPIVSFAFTRTGDVSQPLTVSYRLEGGATPGADYTGPTSGQVTFAAGSATAQVAFTVVNDMEMEGPESLVVILEDGAAYDLGQQKTAEAVIVSDETAPTRISAVQGAGAASGMQGRVVTIEAVVVGDFQNGDGDTARDLGGFFVQEETADHDGDARTSEGLFVYEGAGATLADVAVGTRVRVTGVVTEQFGLTQLQNVQVSVIGTAAEGEVSPAVISLPNADLEAYEGMLVTVPQTLVVSDLDELDRLGETHLYAPEGDGLAGQVAEAADGRPYQFTQIHEPNAAGFSTYQQAVASRTLIYDDGLNGTWRTIQNPNGGGAFNTANAIQTGDSIAGLTGVLDYGFNAFRVRSTADGQNQFQDTNPREAAPADVGGSLVVGSFNVLNFFVTLDDGSRMDNGQTPRGANSEAEFARQVEKLVETLIVLDADVLALVELENDFNSFGVSTVAGGNALGYLVEQLNAALDGDVYSYVGPGIDYVGTDAIAVGFIYKNDVVGVAPGTLIAIDHAAIHDRPPIAVTFEELATGGQFTAVAAHFKSKASGSGPNADKGDGQGRSNADRVAQAHALLTFLATHPTGTTDGDYLLLGDFNAYFQEDPIDVLRAGGYEPVGGPTSYSYTFDGTIGSLDHAMPNGSLLAQVTGSTKWHINADEADALDYNLDADDSNPATNRDPAIFDGSVPYRVSDHDPILVGLQLTPTDKVLTGGDGADTLAGKNGKDSLSGAGGADSLSGGLGDDTLSGGAGDDTLSGGEGADLAIFSGERSTYTAELVDGQVVIVGPDGRDVITGVERFRFADREIGLRELLNKAPTPAADTATAEEDAGVVIDVLANDADPNPGDVLELAAVGQTALGGSVRIVDGKVVYVADADLFDTLGAGQSLVDTFSYTVKDEFGLTSTATVSVTVRGRADELSLAGGNGADSLVGTGADERLDGGNGADILVGAAGSDTLDGGNGADELRGGAGLDSLSGGNGSDLLDGGAGDDRLEGGAGPDRFVFTGGFGDDVITDFGIGDVIQFTGGAVADFADLLRRAETVGSDVVISLDDGSSLTLLGVRESQLRAGDFLFG